ncbi:hypothetical protein HanRHA438_Chr12g0549081 [Helianthus annuus]|nr:hypothetical protein HanOQP8_Chr12g0443761 [Helianthus annuus]KAJ0866208.1 hypothetical protein HanRHA438_Chr12g0549081 [Helianthus annuus]
MEVEDDWELPGEEEVEVGHTLLDFPNTWPKRELVGRTTFTWGFKKKRSILLDMKSESLSQPEKSPSTPLSFLPLPSGGGGGGDHNNRKPPLAPTKVFKRKATDDLTEVYNRLQQEKETLVKQLKAMKTLHQDLTYENLELKAKGQKIKYPRSMEDYHIWNSSMKTVGQQITMFAPARTLR